MSGKGDTYRPVDRDKFAENYDRLFGKCNTHPEYTATRQPMADCITCRRLWREQQLKGGSDGSSQDETKLPS